MWKRFSGMLVLGVAILLVAAACTIPVSDGTALQPTGGSPQETPADSGATAIHAGFDGDVHVILTDFGVELSQTEFEPGVEYTFKVMNAGVVAHELMLIAPHENSTSMEMELHDSMAVGVFDKDDLQPGATVEQTIVFPASGETVVESACFVPGHYEAGMKSDITVLGDTVAG